MSRPAYQRVMTIDTFARAVGSKVTSKPDDGRVIVEVSNVGIVDEFGLKNNPFAVRAQNTERGKTDLIIHAPTYGDPNRPMKDGRLAVFNDHGTVEGLITIRGNNISISKWTPPMIGGGQEIGVNPTATSEPAPHQ